jgi:glycosyltransferase involved in cell wall biosynthesis
VPVTESYQLRQIVPPAVPRGGVGRVRSSWVSGDDVEDFLEAHNRNSTKPKVRAGHSPSDAALVQAQDLTAEMERIAVPDAGEPSGRTAIRRPRVMLVGPMPPTKGGVTTFMLNLMASHLADEFDFVAFTTSRPPKRNVIDNWGYGAVLRGGPRRILVGIMITLWHLLLFPIMVVRRRIDLVQIQASDYHVFWESALYALMARILGRPVVFRIGGAFDIFYAESPPLIRRWIAAVLRLPSCVIAQSGFGSRCIRQAGSKGSLLILPNWAPDANVVEVHRPPTANPCFLFIAGTEARRKGIEELLAAARRLEDRGSPAQFHLLAMTPSLVERVKTLGLSNIRAVEGPAAHARVLAVMRGSDVFLLPSHGEGFPNSLIEAMAAGMASIVTPVGAVPEMVADGGALTIPIGDAAALAEAIDRLARDPALRQKLGREARVTLRTRFTESAALPPLAATYRSLLSRNAANV